MNQPSSPEPEDLPAKPQTLAQCHEVIDTLNPERECVAAAVDAAAAEISRVTA